MAPRALAPHLRRWAALGVAILAAGCGSSAPSQPLAQRACDGARRAAATQRHAMASVTITGRQAADLTCVVSAGGVRAAISSQASGQAWTAYNTETSHQEQVYGPAAPGVHRPGEIPQGLTLGSDPAVWIPAQREVLATDASPGHLGGAYVTVTVSGPAHGAAARALGAAVARAVFAAHPGQGQ